MPVKREMPVCDEVEDDQQRAADHGAEQDDLIAAHIDPAGHNTITAE